MKLRRRNYKFRPDRSINQPSRTWRDWPGWYGVAVAVFIIILLITAIVRIWYG